MSKFFGANTCVFCIFKITIRCGISSAHHVLNFVFAIYKRILHICSTIYMEDTGRSIISSRILEF